MTDERRTLLAVIASNRVQMWMNIALMILFLVQIPWALLTGIKKSIPYLVFLSLWALVASHLSAALAAKAALEAATNE